MAKLHKVLLFACAILCSSLPCIAATYSMIIEVQQRNQIVGEATYDFAFSLQAFNNQSTLMMTSPTGVVHHQIAPQSPILHVMQSNVSLQDLDDTLLGNWTFVETLNGIAKSYLISLPDVPDELFDISVPNITSPSNGERVGKMFDLTWTNADPDGYSIHFSSRDDVPSFRQVLHRNGPGNYTFDFGGITNFMPMTFDAFRIGKRLPTVAIDVTPLSSNGDATFLGRDIDFAVHSPSISFTVVPEPASVIIFGIAVACATGGRGIVVRPARLRCAPPRS